MGTRVILVSGKGGVGKTSVAAATGLCMARRGKKTLVLSFDLAHSLSDAFASQAQLFDTNRGQPRALEANLAIQEIDLYEELQRQWGDTFQLVSGLIYGGNSLQGALAAEVGIMPGMEELVALHCLQERYESAEYEVIVVDCPPTAESLAFVGLVSLLEFYVQNRLPVDRRFCTLIRPIALSIDPTLDMFFPADRHFQVLGQVAGRMASMNETLRDPATTTIRLVTNPEKMIVEETRRAFMYFSMYGLTVDTVVMNRLFPDSSSVYSERVANQKEYLAQVCEDFAPVPVAKVAWMSREVVGMESLASFGEAIYGDKDPSLSCVSAPAYRVVESNASGEQFRLELKLPLVQKDKVDLSRVEKGLAIKIGPFRRVIILPRVLQSLSVSTAKLEDDLLTIAFGAQ